MREVKENNLGLDLVYIKLEKQYTLADDKPIKGPMDAINALADVIKDLDREVTCVICMKTNGAPINAAIVSVGTLNAAMLQPLEIIKTALLSNAKRMIVLHNHPSGGAKPSVDDIRMTDRLNRACDLMGLHLDDHIIIGAASKEWFSFYEKGMIQPYDFNFKTELADLYLAEPDLEQNDKASLPDPDPLLEISQQQMVAENTNIRSGVKRL